MNISTGLRKVEPRIPGAGLSVRLARPAGTPGGEADYEAIDDLHKREKEGLSFLYEPILRKRIETGDMLVAEVSDRVNEESSDQVRSGEPGSLDHSFTGSRFAGFCMGVDRYQKRSELGIIYAMAVEPKYRRSLVAATLLQAQFDKSAYGTKLYCCWCKQSLAANRFWEAMGFVPLAFRAAGRTTIKKVKKKTGGTAGAVHIFWQKKIRVEEQGTSGGWWYPYETQGGMVMEGRVVLPLPPKMQWDEAAPVVLPGAEQRAEEQRLLEGKVKEAAKKERAAKKAPGSTKAATVPTGGAVAPRAVGSGGFGAGFGEPAPPEVSGTSGGGGLMTKNDAEIERIKREKAAAKKALKEAQRRNDPELVAFARELRDRWQEHVAPGGAGERMLEDKQRGKYAVGRLIECGVSGVGAESPQIVEVDNALELDGVKRLDFRGREAA